MDDKILEMVIQLRESVAKQTEEINYHRIETKRLYAELEVIKANEANCPARRLAEQRAGVIQTVKDLTVIATIIVLLLQIFKVIP
jgi:hypothetical protein